MKISDLRIKTKLLLSFALLAVVVLAVSALSIRSLGRSNDRFADYLSGVGQRERLATEVRGAATQRAIAARNFVLVTTAADRELEKAAITQSVDAVHSSFSRLKEALAHAQD
ncbi:MAG TPA: MCP four helix bundle domain-containing protein, partial [Burkholderiaceae bacterium]|nr:MCP four helix bundle domain-containing protein [Burkholderiaceae bacterium]